MSDLGCQARTSACFAGTAREQLPNRPLEEYRAAVATAIARGLLATHSSVGYLRFTQMGESVRVAGRSGTPDLLRC
jgi:hypothetical protein